MSAKTPRDCDCLNDCGDDPWLQDGRCKPCAYRVERIRLDTARSGIVVERAEFNRTGDQLTVTYALPLTIEQQAMVMPTTRRTADTPYPKQDCNINCGTHRP